MISVLDIDSIHTGKRGYMYICVVELTSLLARTSEVSPVGSLSKSILTVERDSRLFKPGVNYPYSRRR